MGTALGMFLVYRIGILEGSFRSNAHWTLR
jgi:hypothetical protein